MQNELTVRSGFEGKLHRILNFLFTMTAVITGGIVAGRLAGTLSPLLTGMACAGVLAALLVVSRPDLAFYLFFSGIVIMTDCGPEASGTFFIPDADILKGLPAPLATFFLLIFCATVARRILIERLPMPVSLRGFAVYLIILFVAILTGLFKGGDRELIYFDFMKMLFPVLCFYLCLILLPDRARICRLLTVLFSAAALKAVFLSAAYLAGRGWAYQLDDSEAYQVATMDSADLLVFITLVLIAMYLLVRGDIRGIRAGLVCAACIPMIFVIVFSYRRAQWLGMVLSMGLLFLGASKTVRKRIVMLSLAALCAGGAVAAVSGISEDKLLRIAGRITSVFDSNQSSNRFHRFEARQVLLDLAGSPLFGLGLGTNHSPIGHGMDESDSVPRNVVHNTFLYVLMKTGLPGFLFFLWAAIVFARRIFRFRKKHQTDGNRDLVLPLASSSGLWLAMFLTGPVLWYLHQTFLLALFAAMQMSLILQADQSPEMVREATS